MPTIMITGCSSGFGLATARLFADRGWDVIATVRNHHGAINAPLGGMRVLPLDVTDARSVTDAAAAAGRVDVLVNNAGIGFMNALEGTPIDTARRLFETNTLGVMAMMQAVVPQMRARGRGTIVNVGSSATGRSDPLLSAYTASKAALNAFSENVALELEPLGVRLRVVIPGRAPTTAFNDSARAMMTDWFPEPYAAMGERILAGWERDTSPTTTADDVALAVWTAATDPTSPFYIPAGPDASVLVRAA